MREIERWVEGKKREERWNLREEQDARKVQYPGLTLGQQPVKSNMRTLFTSVSYNHITTGCVYLFGGESKKSLNTMKQWKMEE